MSQTQPQGSQVKKTKKCDNCKEEKNARYYSTHIKICNNQGKFACKDCDNKFARKDRLEDHGITHHKKVSTRTINCEYCFKLFYLRYSYKKHMRSHTSEVSVCSVCQKSFNSEINLSCKICDQTPGILN